MSEVIGTVTLLGTKIEGTTQEVASHIFKEIICPNTEMLAANDPQAAMVFAFHVMGLAISQYAEFVSTKKFEKTLNTVTHNLVQNLKKERGELNS